MTASRSLIKRGQPTVYHKITWDAVHQCPLVGKPQTETTNKGLWVHTKDGIDMLHWNGRFICAGSRRKDRKDFLDTLAVMAHPRDRADYLMLLDSLCPFERNVKYV